MVITMQLPEYPVVMEMYAVGKSLGPQLMAEIGDVRQSPNLYKPPIRSRIEAPYRRFYYE